MGIDRDLPVVHYYEVELEAQLPAGLHQPRGTATY